MNEFRLARNGLLSLLLLGGFAYATSQHPLPVDNRALYTMSCAACHGHQGRGAPAGMVGFDVPLPDFTDCNFVTREPTADWIIVVQEGGPARGFSEIMPAFGDALTVEQITSILAYIKTFSDCDEWPRGEMNLPRALYTSKAFPEDELVLSSDISTDGLNKLSNKMIYGKRIGARSQIEVTLPFGWQQIEKGDPGGEREWTSELGDLALGVKHVLFHNFDTKSIITVAGEIVLPTGDEDAGFGDGTTVFEPYLAYGQLFPADFFFQCQGGFKLPFEDQDFNKEAFFKMAAGKTISVGRYGRGLSPMVEILGAQDLETGDTPSWDIVPQIQIPLNTRQHVRLGVGARIPLNDRDFRSPVYGIYLLWDTFDGGFFDGW